MNNIFFGLKLVDVKKYLNKIRLQWCSWQDNSLEVQKRISRNVKMEQPTGLLCV